jgi:nitric oxide reductase NorQ protein
MSTAEVADFVKQSVKYKPKDLVIPEVSWKYLIRSALRGKNILMLGPSGCGKTMAAQALARVFKDRPHEVFNMGASQDPRGMLIGNTHFNKETGTFFAESLFVKMIQTPGAIILLDEISRAHDDAANILMSVLDENQRYLRIDEHPNTPTIPVAQGVVFIATANVGHEYTGTRVMDRALLDRFIIVEMQPMSKDAELQLLTSRFPDVETKWLAAIAEIAEHTRQQLRSEDPKISTVISTRMSVEIASLLADGFTLAEAAEVCIYPFYPAVGGVDSERTYMQQLVQKYLPTAYDDKEKPWEENKIPWETT